MNEPAPRLLLTLSGLTPRLVADIAGLVDLAVAAEGWGAGGVVLGEHIVWVEGMRHPGGEVLSAEFVDSVPDSVVLLSAIASRTTDSWLVAGTLVGALRHPLLVARQAATLSRISEGRFHLGLAAGWSPEEFAALGIPFDERFSRLDEVLQACAALWAAPATGSHRGRHYRYDGVIPTPRPWSGRVPIWIGGGATARTMRRVAAHGDGWVAGIAAGPDQVEHGMDLLQAAVAGADRQLPPPRVMAHLTGAAVARREAALEDRIGQLVEHVARLQGAGATDVILPLGLHADHRGEMEPIVRAVARELGPVSTSCEG